MGGSVCARKGSSEWGGIVCGSVLGIRCWSKVSVCAMGSWWERNVRNAGIFLSIVERVVSVSVLRGHILLKDIALYVHLTRIIMSREKYANARVGTGALVKYVGKTFNRPLHSLMCRSFKLVAFDLLFYFILNQFNKNQISIFKNTLEGHS